MTRLIAVAVPAIAIGSSDHLSVGEIGDLSTIRPRTTSIAAPILTRAHQIALSTGGDEISAIPAIWTVRLRTWIPRRIAVTWVQGGGSRKRIQKRDSVPAPQSPMKVDRPRARTRKGGESSIARKEVNARSFGRRQSRVLLNNHFMQATEVVQIAEGGSDG